MRSQDQKTAAAFAYSWNTQPLGSTYTFEQFLDWFSPITKDEVKGKEVLELGCGNASLLYHMVQWDPQDLVGIDLGDSVDSAAKNMRQTGFARWEVKKADLLEYNERPFDLVYCIGVLHHLQHPELGWESVLRNTKSGGRFHCWVYAKEGNALVRAFVEPLRRIASRLPRWMTKYVIATPLAVPFCIYAKTLKLLQGANWAKRLPLFDYAQWISRRGFRFFRHVAFDQLVTPHTVYIDKQTVVDWLDREEIERASTYIIMRNGNSWKFGGRKR